MKMTGVSGFISAAHYSREGVLHGHTWQVMVWWQSENYMTSADCRKQLLLDYLQKFDHSVLPEQLSWGEDLAERIGLDMDAAAVDISRPLEGIYAKWCKE